MFVSAGGIRPFHSRTLSCLIMKTSHDFLLFLSLGNRDILWTALVYFIKGLKFSILLSEIAPNIDCSNKILKVVLLFPRIT